LAELTFADGFSFQKKKIGGKIESSFFRSWSGHGCIFWHLFVDAILEGERKSSEKPDCSVFLCRDKKYLPSLISISEDRPEGRD
jgi:hypothetical protein